MKDYPSWKTVKTYFIHNAPPRELPFYTVSSPRLFTLFPYTTLFRSKLLALRERYANDKQAQSKAMMELYQKEKINPLGEIGRAHV